MKPLKWVARNAYYFTFAFVLLLVSSVAAYNNSGSPLFSNPDIDSQNQPPVAVVQAEASAQVSTANDNNTPVVNPEQDYYIDASGNWIAGSPPPEAPKTSSWCGEKKRKKWQIHRCEDISCLDGSSGWPRMDRLDSCDPCAHQLAQIVCTHLDDDFELEDS